MGRRYEDEREKRRLSRPWYRHEHKLAQPPCAARDSSPAPKRRRRRAAEGAADGGLDDVVTPRPSPLSHPRSTI